MVLHARILAALIALATAALPVSAPAQDRGAAPGASTPSYARTDESVRGRIVSFDGGYNLEVNDERGFVDYVRLHPGTVINPTGIRLVPGMSLTVYGETRGNTFSANEIDTPYQPLAAYPVYPAPYPYAYPYPYPVYAYPFSVGIGIGFGPVFHRGFHGGFHRGFW
jgi:hypothetical protein